MRNRSRRLNVAVILFTFIVAICVGSIALSASLHWTNPTTYADGTNIPDSVKATLTGYIRINKTNPRDTTGKNGWYYAGEARNGGTSWPSDNDIDALLRSWGFEGQEIQLTVSSAYKASDGQEYDSALSEVLAYTVPFVVRGATQAPTVLEVR